MPRYDAYRTGRDEGRTIQKRPCDRRKGYPDAAFDGKGAYIRMGKG